MYDIKLEEIKKNFHFYRIQKNRLNLQLIYMISMKVVMT